MSRDETPCQRGCCWTPFGCAKQYSCAHHAEAQATRQEQLISQSLQMDLRLHHRRAGDPLSVDEKDTIEALRGVETARMIADRYSISEPTVRNIWAKQNRRLKSGART